MKKVTTTLGFLLLVSSFTLAQAVKKDVAVKKAAVVKANKTKIVNNGVQNANATTYDFTTGSSQYYGGTAGAKELQSGVWGMIAGDGNGNGQVQNNDAEDVWAPANGTAGYLDADFNMNGQVQNNDKEDYWKPNNGKGTQVP